MNKNLFRLTAALLALLTAAAFIVPAVPSSLAFGAAPTKILQIAGGENHAVALCVDGSGIKSVWAWGKNDYGQLGDNSNKTSLFPVKVDLPDGLDIASVAAGAHHSFAVTNTGEVYAWGHNKFGQLGDGTTSNRKKPVKIPKFTADQISAGLGHSAAIDKNGKLYTWGLNSFGQLGHGGNKTQTEPKEVTEYGVPGSINPASFPALFDKAVCGANHTVAAAGGKLYAFGANDSGQLGLDDYINRDLPEEIPVIGYAGNLFLACGGKHTMAVLDGNIYGWGDNTYGQVDPWDVSFTSCKKPYRISAESRDPDGKASFTSIEGKVLDAQAGLNHNLILYNDGADKVFTFGFNSRGQLGSGESVPKEGHAEVEFADVTGASPSSLTQIFAGGLFSGALEEDALNGSDGMWLWGDNSFGQQSTGTQMGMFSGISVERPNYVPMTAFDYGYVCVPKSIKATPSRLIMAIDATATNCSITPLNFKPSKPPPAKLIYEYIKWESGNKEIVVFDDGTPDGAQSIITEGSDPPAIRGVDAGLTTVTATAHNGKKSVCTVIVRPDPQPVKIKNMPLVTCADKPYIMPKKMLYADKPSIQLKAQIVPKDAADKALGREIVWSLITEDEFYHIYETASNSSLSLADIPPTRSDDPANTPTSAATITKDGFLKFKYDRYNPPPSDLVVYVLAYVDGYPESATVFPVYFGVKAKRIEAFDPSLPGTPSSIREVPLLCYSDTEVTAGQQFDLGIRVMDKDKNILNKGNPVYSFKKGRMNSPYFDIDGYNSDGTLRIVAKNPGLDTIYLQNAAPDGSGKSAIRVKVVPMGTKIELASPKWDALTPINTFTSLYHLELGKSVSLRTRVLPYSPKAYRAPQAVNWSGTPTSFVQLGDPNAAQTSRRITGIAAGTNTQLTATLKFPDNLIMVDPDGKPLTPASQSSLDAKTNPSYSLYVEVVPGPVK